LVLGLSARAFDENVESVMGDSHEGANQIQGPHWNKGASHWMGKPYSDDLRERVVAAIEAGHTRVKVAELYNMALSTVGGIIKRKRETGSVSPDKFGGYKTFTLEPHTDRVKELVAEQPDSTLAELQVRLAKEKVKVSQSGISRFLRHINVTFKKKSYTRPNKIGPTSPPPVRRYGKNRKSLIRNNLSSSMRPPPPPR
jgi:transposase